MTINNHTASLGKACTYGITTDAVASLRDEIEAEYQSECNENLRCLDRDNRVVVYVSLFAVAVVGMLWGFGIGKDHVVSSGDAEQFTVAIEYYAYFVLFYGAQLLGVGCGFKLLYRDDSEVNERKHIFSHISGYMTAVVLVLAIVATWDNTSTDMSWFFVYICVACVVYITFMTVYSVDIIGPFNMVKGAALAVIGLFLISTIRDAMSNDDGA